MFEAPHGVRIGSASSFVIAVATLLLASAHDVAGQRPGGADPGDAGAPTWRAGLEVGRLPSLRLGWETPRDGWILGVAAGVGPGSGDVDARLTPSVRLGRRLAGGLRADVGLGLELARLERAGNPSESEIQWEMTGAWHAPSGWGAEVGVRRTDYGREAWEPLVRLSAPGTLLGTSLPMATARAPHSFGAPRPVAEAGRLGLGVRAPGRVGSGVSLAASNPRGDPDPWKDASGPNVDRLGMRAEAWTELGPLAAWARWSSDLHRDPAIAGRVQPVAEGAGFPVTVSFAGGATWSDPEDGSQATVGVRHDPKVFLWMPHLGEERTARARALSAEGHVGRVALSATHGALDPIGGRTVQPLEHVRLAARSRGRWSVGVAHEQVTREVDGTGAGRRRRSATLVSVSRRGVLRGRLAAGSDLVLRVGIGAAGGGSPGGSPWGQAAPWNPDPRPRSREDPANDPSPVGFWAGADVELRSAPALLDYEALVGGGWMADIPDEENVDRPVATGSLSAGWGPVTLEAAAGRKLPIWTGDAVDRVDGGRVDAVVSGRLGAVPGRGQVRLRVGEWGPPSAWWREEATLEGHVRMPLRVGAAGELGIELHGRSALHGTRSGHHEHGGIEATLILAVPLPMGSLGAAGRMEARLEDVLDRGLPTRVAAPERGRRLTVLVLWLAGR